MKTPQRRFVVEFKSGRRQPKAQTKSIWGDTDLKALARDVEETASHLFNSDEALGTPDSVEPRLADPVDAEPVNGLADDAGVALAAIPIADGAEVEISKHHGADHPAEAVVQGREIQPTAQPRTTGTETPRRRAKRAPAQTIAQNSKPGHKDRDAQIGSVDNPVSRDELAALDADNKRLKRLLAERLREQNLWLNKKLERFNAD
ncbi:conserved hypothetical protein (plasmid) [Sinorhizobium fredii NGR234]|uniref:Uncharacterized protein n=1 Tax=Sinorhizobium fredii (strain NBRC 101917 / NGR234) TaxID=394 RepID=C3KN44_SINFN|nr:hypothetical protein [Sinorhizobium fredii]ACP21617.1 conserved hypothetical protein [Sinorhizobium fredii NGR234]